MIEGDYNFANIGTIYLLDAIEIICKSEDYMNLLVNLEKNVYKQIAKRYNVNEKNKEIVSKQTPKIVINNIVDKIKNCDKDYIK